MANQPEEATYDAGVYQYEIVDPVRGGVGGIANAPILNLANRTGWLKNQIASLLAGLAAFAPINSPLFTGSPVTPAPPDGDISALIPNTTFTNNLVRGISTVNIAGSGNIVLTQAQWGRGILVLNGALTGARSVIVPLGGRWIVDNATSGAFALTVKTASGTGVVVAQGRAQEVWADGVNVDASRSDFDSIALTGASTVVAPAPTDNSARIPSAAWVNAALLAAFVSPSLVTAPSLGDNSTNIPDTDWVNATIAGSAVGKNFRVYTDDGTFSVPAGITEVDVLVVGGGSGASGCGTNAVFGGGFTGPVLLEYAAGACGGGGGWSRKMCAVTPGDGIGVTVGTGGSGSAFGVASGSGGTSSFGSFCSATGGGTASSGSIGNDGGIGGFGIGGDISGFGGDGSDGLAITSSASTFWAGRSGGSILGGSRKCYLNSVGATEGEPNPGRGGSAPYSLTGTTVSGAPGNDGIVIVRW